jgi:ribonucleoside-diphosphate reductase alpha chain
MSLSYVNGRSRPAYDGIKWVKRDAVITRMSGEVVFKQVDVEVPEGWSDLALQVVAQKYFRGKLNADGTPGPGRETSIRQLIDRVVDTIAGWAGYYSECDLEVPDWIKPDADGVYNMTGDLRIPVEDTVDCAPGLDIYRAVGGERAACHKRPKEVRNHYGHQMFQSEAYFQDRASWETWKNDLKNALVNQKVCFNSPVWFNVGADEWPQCSACFILRLEDWMNGPVDEEFSLDSHGLLAAQVKEGLIFSRGSGSGINLSRVRSPREWLKSGGRPTGPLSFARGLDTWAASIKSGGKTRRAAKMLILDVDHPDINEFIDCKAEEEKIAKKLIASGMSPDMDGEAYQHAFHQNSNLSVRANDAFMTAALIGGTVDTISRSKHHLEDKPDAISQIGVEGKVIDKIDAKEILHRIAQRTWECGDPGMQFHTTINRMHTCRNDGPIVASNPCSEYMFLDETSCNLASFNLKKYFPTRESLEDLNAIRAFEVDIEAITIAMDVIVSGARYPTENIRRMSNAYRTLGVGFANLGGMLMAHGVPYDSAKGRAVAASITALMTSCVYDTSVAMSQSRLGPCQAFARNRDCFIDVMKAHRDSCDMQLPSLMKDIASARWQSIVRNGSEFGIRNAQATVLAPTGTIAFMMDCETTGIEPELGLVKYKTLSGKGNLALPNPSIVPNLVRLGFTTESAESIADKIANGESPDKILTPDIAEIFRTSFPPSGNPEFSLPWRAHVDMMSACQPFISGAISKTVNMPKDSTVEDIEKAYLYAWQRGLKAIAIYRDGSKGVQPVSVKASADGGTGTSSDKDVEKLVAGLQSAQDKLDKLEDLLAGGGTSIRRKPPREVHHVRIRFEIDGHKGYLFVGFYEDTEEPCEIFVTLSKTGSALQGFTNAFCVCFSMLLQYGVPLEKLVQQFQDTEFEPKGIVPDDLDIRSCRSVIDFIVRKVQAVTERMGKYHLVEVDEEEGSELELSNHVSNLAPLSPQDLAELGEGKAVPVRQSRKSGKVCARCGSFNVQIMGKCLQCHNCGSEEGGCFA